MFRSKVSPVQAPVFQDKVCTHLRRIFVMLFLMGLRTLAVRAQTGGQAGIQGTVTDQSGAAVPNVTVTAINNATGVSTVRESTASGLYTISPIIPGTYTVTATAKGFQGFKQENLSIDALKLTGLNITMSVGSETQEITVSAEPPALETTNAVLGGVMQNETYQNLPLQMNSQQRDPTAFAVLVPGVQGGTRAPIIGGTGNFLAQVYVDGLPIVTVNQQGDNRTVSNAIPVEAIDQFQVVTSTPGAEYGGAGLINFTLKSGGNAYHGTAAIFVRNTIFDTWGFSSPAVTKKDENGNTVPAGKPVEHQNEIVGAVGGPIPLTQKKGFFFAAYDRYHGRNGINPNTLTVPTLAMRGGDFGSLLTRIIDPITKASVIQGQIYDPTSTVSCTSHSTNGPCRYQFGYGYGGAAGPNGNPVLIGTPNVIPASLISPIAAKMASYLPDPSNSANFNNFIGGVATGFDNHEFATRVDFDITSKQRLSYVLTIGTRKNVPFSVGGTPAGVVLPLPYTAGGTAVIKPTLTDVEHTWTITPRIVNQLKFGFARFAQPIGSLTDGVAPYRAAADFGITGLPEGQASDELPGATFAATALFGTPVSPWTSNGASGATQTTVPNTYTLLDNLQLVKGEHNITIGGQIQWLQDNVASQTGPSGILTIPYTANSTAGFPTGANGQNATTLNTTTSGFSYASYLLGAASQSSIAIQAVAETGGRYRTIAPYIQDDWKVTQKLTLNIGLRWDYLPPFHEVQDRWSFLNPNLTNPITGTPGALQFAGDRGAGVSCQCRTPVQTWWKNFGPRIGLAYAVTAKTVLRAGYGLSYSIGGGVGGRAGAGNGTGNLGFNATATTAADINTGAAQAGPSFYLNNSTGFQALGLSNTRFGGPTFVLPTTPAPSAASASLNTGNYTTASGAAVNAGSMAFADPYLSGRAPEFNFFNAGLQQAFTNDLTMTLNYAGTQSHFLAPSSGNARGLYTNQLDPKYLAALGAVMGSDGSTPLLNAAATPANVAILKANYAGAGLPYANFLTTQTIAQALVAFPQYSGVTDTWGQNVANISYHSLQLSFSQREWHGLSYTANYTWSKNLGDDGTFRSGYDLPAGATSNGQAYKANRIDRGETITNVPHNVSVYGVYQSPFGKGKIGGSSFLMRALAGGWQFSGIYTFTSGAPLVITYAGCTSPKLGQCQMDLNPNFKGKNPRINGRLGTGTTAANLGTIPYIDKDAFQLPGKFSAGANALNKIGTAPRTAPYGLHAPSKYNMDVSLRRTFNLSPERFRLVLEADGLNITNKSTFGNIAVAWSPTVTNLGSVQNATGNRDFQFAGRINF